MDDDMHRYRVDELHREREQLIEQIRSTQKTIKHSRALLKRIDELLAKGSPEEALTLSAPFV